MRELALERRLQRVINRIAAVIPLNLSRKVGKRKERLLISAGESSIDVSKAIGWRYLVERFGRIEMDAAQGYPSKFQLSVLPKLCFGSQVPLPVVGNVGVVFDSLFRTAASAPIKKIGSIRSRGQIQQPFASRSNCFRSVVGFNSHENANWVT